MPRIAKRSKSAYAKRYKKRKTDKDMPVPYSMYKGVMPRSVMVPLRYTELLQFSEAITGFSYNVFRANSVFDPNLTGGGHQPLGNDQWGALYLNYRVHKCTIDVQFSQQQSTVPILASVVPSENSTAISAWLEQPGTKTVMVAQDTAGPNVGRINMTMDMRKYDGDAGAFASDDMQALVGNNPAEVKFFHVFAANAAGGNSVDAIAFVQLDYLVEFFNSVPLTGS